MPAELLIPMMGGLPGNIGRASQSVKVTDSVPGFKVTLKAAERAINKLHQDSRNLRKPLSENQLNLRKSPVKDSHGEDEDSCLPEAGMVETGPIAQTGVLLIEAMEPDILTGLMVISTPSATRNLIDSGEPNEGLPINPAFAKTPAELGLLASATAAIETATDTTWTFVPGGSTLSTQSETIGDRAQNSTNMEYSGNWEVTKNHAILRPDSVNGAKIGEGGGESWPGEEKPPVAAAVDTSRSNKLCTSETLHPANLITAESEKLRGVKTQIPVESEGMIQSPHSSAETVLVEKVGLSQKPVSAEDILGQIVKKIELFPNQKPNVVTIKLEPEFLGRLQINLEVMDDVLIAKFSTENHQVKQLLETGIGQLRTQLEATGLRLERVEVNIDLGQHHEGFQHHNQSSYQSRQPIPYEVINYYPGQYASDQDPPESVENHVTTGEYSDGSINYLI